jgi:NAD(P)-dependent dehydrogenase (short-subunit alcohol dehydrogenase family)
MTETLVVCGYGPGISDGVARKFGAEGFHVALVARNAQKLEAAVVSLGEAGITAKGFPCDLADPAAVQAMIDDVRESLGPVTVIHYNAYAGVAGDVAAPPSRSPTAKGSLAERWRGLPARRPSSRRVQRPSSRSRRRRSPEARASVRRD